MTLTGALPEGQKVETQRLLSTLFASIAEPLHIDGFAIFRQKDPAARFIVWRRFAFLG